MIPCSNVVMEATASRFGNIQVDIINANMCTETNNVVHAVNVIKRPVGTLSVTCNSTIAT